MTNKDRALLNMSIWGVLSLMFLTSKITFDSLSGPAKVLFVVSFAFYAGSVIRYVWTIVREK